MNRFLKDFEFNVPVSLSSLTKGKRIAEALDVQLIKYPTDLSAMLMEGIGEWTFKVSSESFMRKKYDVKITYDPDDNKMDHHCNCEAHLSYDECKHVGAAFWYLESFGFLDDIKMLDDITSIHSKKASLQGQAPVIQMPAKAKEEQLKTYLLNIDRIEEWHIKQHLKGTYLDTLKQEIKKNIITIEEQANKKVTATYQHSANTVYKVSAERVKDGIEVTCNCNEKKGSLCRHTAGLLLKCVKDGKNRYFLDTLIDTEPLKAALLQGLGLSPSDKEASFYQFYFEEKEFKMKPTRLNILIPSAWKSINETISKGKKAASPEKKIVLFNSIVPMIRDTGTGFPGIKVCAYTANKDTALNELGEEVVLEKPVQQLKKMFPDFWQFLYAFTAKGMEGFVIDNKTSSYGYYNFNPTYSSDEEKSLLNNFFRVTALENIETLATTDWYYFKGTAKKIPLKSAIPIHFGPQPLRLHVTIKQQDKFVHICYRFFSGGSELPSRDYRLLTPAFVLIDQILYVFENYASMVLFQELGKQGEWLMPVGIAKTFIEQQLWPLKNDVVLEVDESFLPQVKRDIMPSFSVELKEMEPDFLMIEPIANYDGKDIEITSQDEIVQASSNAGHWIQRDMQKEKAFIALVQQQHEKFTSQNDLFYLRFSDALKDGWFFNFTKTIKENGHTVYGQEGLKKFRYNANAPVVKMKTGSGIDWFDLMVEIEFGEQSVGLQQIKEAIKNKQGYVILGDGTFGLLPQEWLKQFMPLLRMGKLESDGSLKVSKLHYTLVDEMHGLIDNEEILQELEQKKQQLKNIDTHTPIPLPAGISASLRPYQQAGYNWFNLLHSIGWGGLLADDMGLGKTLQTLCFMQRLVDENLLTRLLVICPTSLLYNWEAELNKFTKGITYVIHHGGDRLPLNTHENHHHVIITSYGTLRSDIEQFTNLVFDVVFIDESQAIKNPAAQVTKAVQLLKTKQRFALSGTPVQNNTFDLYAQMNFVNPGILGSMEFFKTEYANVIDKNTDPEKTSQLRKIVYPFILRRTKEQVAKDLPDKTETILYCEMSSYQQKTYDQVKNYYREKILEKIETEGIQASAFLLLEGLTKMRMLCDCPSLVKDKKGKPFKQDSIKLDEIMREIEENISNHKLLIFSQFLGMLDLLKQRLDKDKIPYLYLDGSTPATERNNLVNQFQTGKHHQVFLISLKAGGVGLNLTAADYVYILDPWWNPAVEDQAIDRTHRIGQQKNIFAYKFICKNTIEEKIIQLQEKKKSLVKELITEDQAFIKKLNKEDVKWLLS